MAKAEDGVEDDDAHAAFGPSAILHRIIGSSWRRANSDADVDAVLFGAQIVMSHFLRIMGQILLEIVCRTPILCSSTSSLLLMLSVKCLNLATDWEDNGRDLRHVDGGNGNGWDGANPVDTRQHTASTSRDDKRILDA